MILPVGHGTELLFVSRLPGRIIIRYVEMHLVSDFL